MYSNTLSKIFDSCCGRLFAVLLTAFFSFIFITGQAQNCTSPPGTLVNGDFDLPVTAITPNDVPAINNNMPGWFVSHGDPTTSALPDRSMWMWSYSSRGEGVFNCYNFQQGQSYLICFDLQTNGKADGATVDVRASSGLTAPAGANYNYPVVANELIWQDLVANYNYNNWTRISVVYTPSSNYSQIWFHPFWTGNPPGTPAPQGNPSQSEMRIDNVSIIPIDPDNPCPCDLTADYSYSTTDTDCAVQFNDASSGNCCTNVIGWQWDFGDGTTATGANPLHTFPSSGTYTVCLTTVGLNSEGQCCTDSICYDITVECDTCECGSDPNFSYSVNPETCEVIFTDQTTADPCFVMYNWQWNFGDGNSSNQQNPVHTYTSSGTYNVCLIVWGHNGQIDCEPDTICKMVTVDCGDPCVCDIDADFNMQIDRCRIIFNDISTRSNCTQITNWKWDFGDGNTSAAQNPVHQYSTSGTYTICLTVYGTDGTQNCKDVQCYTVNVNCDDDCPCFIDVDFAYDLDGCRVNFFGFGNSDCPIVGWSWDFGDGNTSNQQNPSHIYSSGGIYNVCLTVLVQAADGTLCSETFCLPVHVPDCEQGLQKTSGSVNGTTPELPFEPRLYPNPTSGTLFIEFDTEEAMDIKIEVFNSTMQHIATLIDASHEAGHHKVEWQAEKNKIARGTYYVLLKSGAKVKFEKVILKD